MTGTRSHRTGTPAALGALPWTAPVVRRLKAGGAESSGAASDDGVIGNS